MSQQWIVAYDITSPRRLARVHRYLSGRALALQKSVFFWRGTPAEFIALRRQLAALIRPSQDDIRLYPLPVQAGEFRGRAAFPAGLLLLGQGLEMPMEYNPDLETEAEG